MSQPNPKRKFDFTEPPPPETPQQAAIRERKAKLESKQPILMENRKELVLKNVIGLSMETSSPKHIQDDMGNLAAIVTGPASFRAECWHPKEAIKTKEMTYPGEIVVFGQGENSYLGVVENIQRKADYANDVLIEIIEGRVIRKLVPAVITAAGTAASDSAAKLTAD